MLKRAFECALVSICDQYDFPYESNPRGQSDFSIAGVLQVKYSEYNTVDLDYRMHPDTLDNFLPPQYYLLDNYRGPGERAGFAIARCVLVDLTASAYPPESGITCANEYWCSLDHAVPPASVGTQYQLAYAIGNDEMIHSWSYRNGHPSTRELDALP